MAQLATGSKPEEDSPQVGDEGEEVEEEPQYAEEFDTEPEEAEGAGDQQRVEGAREEEGVPTVAPPSDDEADRQDPDAGPPQLCGEKPTCAPAFCLSKPGINHWYWDFFFGARNS